MRSIPVKSKYLVAIVVVTIFSLLCEANVWLFVSLIVLLTMFGIYSKDFKKNVFFLFFLIAFFTFLMSGQLVHDFFGYNMSYVRTDGDFDFLNLIIVLSLISLALGYSLGGKVTFSTKKHSPSFNRDNLIRYRKLSKAFFYVLSVPWFLILAEQIMIVQTLSYADYYTFQSRLPGIVDSCSEACPLMFCVFLGTFPKKKEASTPIFIVALYATISLLAGRRIYFATYFMLLLAYMIIRNEKDGEKWLSKKQIVMLVASIPFILVFLFSYKYIRYGREIQSKSFLDSFIGFFAQQGFSANLIVTAKYYANEIPRKLYSFVQTIKFLRLNPFTRYVLGLDYSSLYSGNTAYKAMNGGAFASIMSYLLMPVGYSKGLGVGSCYIAELYVDFGYIGIFVGNFLYGFIINHFLKLEKNRVFKNAIALYMFRLFLTAPRYNYDRPFAVFLSFSFLSAFFILYLANNLLIKRNERGVVYESIDS